MNEFEYIKESTSQEMVLTFYVNNERYILSSSKTKWILYKENEKINEYISLDSAFSEIRINNRNLYELLIVEKNEYEFV